MPKELSQKAQIDAFIDRYDPEIARQFRGARTQLRKYFSRGYELVYDNYNALGIGYAFSEKASGVVMSVVAYPRWISVFFFNGARLNDPKKLLKGSGSRIRHLVLSTPGDLTTAPIRQLIAQCLKPFAEKFAAAPKRVTLIKAAMAKRRPRRP